MARIQDVARHANVSVSTVSYVLSGKRPISAATRDRVRASIEILGYRPQSGSPGLLAKRRTNVLALAMPLRAGVHLPVAMQFLASVVARARELDYDVLMLSRDEGDNGLQRVQEKTLADVLLVHDIERHDSRLSFLRTLRTPSVLVGLPASTAGLTCVDLDYKAAGGAAVEHLVDLGHRKIGVVGCPAVVYRREASHATRLLAGIRDAAQLRRVQATAEPCEPTPAGLEQTLSFFLDRNPDTTALIVHNEAVVEGVIAALTRRGRRVPDDISVLVVGPEDLSRRFDVSTVAIPTGKIGRRAVEIALDKLRGEDVPAATLLTPRLVDRGSTAVRTTHRPASTLTRPSRMVSRGGLAAAAG